MDRFQPSGRGSGGVPSVRVGPPGGRRDELGGISKAPGRTVRSPARSPQPLPNARKNVAQRGAAPGGSDEVVVVDRTRVDEGDFAGGERRGQGVLHGKARLLELG